jgi:hypothetical protein|tara:strand:+ start:428 stop:661 length:234 start_codon:yes stop_codon:yes gene_type:complete
MNKAEVDTYRNEIIDRLARLEEKHDSHMDITKEIRVDVKYQNGRVGKLEQKQSWVVGTLGAITFVFSGLIAWIKGEI